MVRSARPRRGRLAGILLWILPPETSGWRLAAHAGIRAARHRQPGRRDGGTAPWAAGEVIVPGEGSGGIVGAIWRNGS